MSGLCGAATRGAAVGEDGSGPGRIGRNDLDAALDTLVPAGVHRGRGGIVRRRSPDAAFARFLPAGRHEVRNPAGETAGLILVADARLDNRRELIDQLSSRAAPLDGADDERLILAAYRRWGDASPEHLLGDFAFAVRDRRRDRLFAARDPMGMRPFYYHVAPERVLFGSEVAQLLEALPADPALSEGAVAAYLAGLDEDDGRTCYEGIRLLPPGHHLVVDREEIRMERWWRLEAGRRISYPDDREYVEHFRTLFREAVRCRLRASAPVGLFLSGGLDSGAVAGFGGNVLEEAGGGTAPLRAYSWAFEELAVCDERKVSGPIARRYGLPVTDVPADDAWPLSGYPAHGPHRDEPYVGVYQALIERGLAAAREDGVGTMMTGHRGDLVAGEYLYDYTGLLLDGRWIRLAREAAVQADWRGTSTAGELLRRAVLPLRHHLWPSGRLPRLRSALRNVYRAVRPFRVWADPWVRRDFLQAALSEGARSAPPTPSALRGARHHARRTRFETIFSAEHMRGVRWSERTHAAFGLEFADPWSDLRLAEFAIAVPQRVLNVTGEEKRLVRRALEGVVPEESRGRMGKVSPFPLYERALRDRETDRVLDLLTDAEVERRGWVDAVELRSRFEAYLEGGSFPHGMWATLALEMWLRRFWA